MELLFFFKDISNGGGRGVGGRYGSAYGDANVMFGSFGSFFDLDHMGEGVGDDATKRIHHLHPRL